LKNNTKLLLCFVFVQFWLKSLFVITHGVLINTNFTASPINI
jgi:hypothetical protein